MIESNLDNATLIGVNLNKCNFFMGKITKYITAVDNLYKYKCNCLITEFFTWPQPIALVHPCSTALHILSNIYKLSTVLYLVIFPMKKLLNICNAVEHGWISAIGWGQVKSSVIKQLHLCF